MNRKQDLLDLAKKKGNDADLLLLDKIHALEDQVNSQPPEDQRVEKIATRLAAKLATLEKGDKGDVGPAGQSIKGDKGDTGADSTVPGPQGPKGDKGDKGEPGQHGEDGEDGQDGKDADTTELLKQIADLKEELEARFTEFEGKASLNKSGQPVVDGPGKTKLIVLDLSSQLDGTTKTFQLGTNFGIVNVSSSSAPFGAFRPIIDYNAVGKTIVFTANVDAPSALAAGQSLIITYLR